MPVQQHVLNWLYSVLTSEYHDVNRTYNDVAHVLTRFSTLTPRTDVHTFHNGVSALLLHLSGTLPVLFRGTTYRFPISIWVPHAYPREAPLVYVTPTETMVVRPGQHVDPQGQVYHPYLAGWSDFWDKSTIQDFLSVLSDVFAKEPPVIARQQSRPTIQSPPPQAPPPVPPLPPEMASPIPAVQTHPGPSESRPPPPPPKPHQEPHFSPAPPVPPNPLTGPPVISPLGHSRVPSRYDSAPPLPPQTQASGSSYQNRPPPIPHQQTAPAPALPPQSVLSPVHPLGQVGQQGPPFGQGHWQQVPPPAWERTVSPPKPQQPPPPSNLLDDPLALDIPTHAISAPPIPPNPEKDALLGQLAQTLASIRQRSRQQNDSSMAGLQAQRTAMLSAMSALQAEMGQLGQLSNAIASNANILHDALRRADSVVEGSRSHIVPDIDELLVAPTVVSNQLYRVVAEERALGDAIFMLGRAMERGRISPAAFAKMTRSLAREWYLKKALSRKIAEGMGLIIRHEN
ncbi:Tumor susceptibility gene protein [Cladobotryum mycophilum]|uniref:Tumor susceptibility gene protein n=1 Tax=Cladobotryum mycophilum TaxID=491253 RepID=A0ABR0SRW6_9HYPO